MQGGNLEQELRRQRGEEIAKTCFIRKSSDGWLVPSQSGARTYLVSSRQFEPICACPDFEHRKRKCKHIFAVEFTLRHEIDQQGNIRMTKTMKVSYSQNWSSYDKSAIAEKKIFLKLLGELCKEIEQPQYNFGRPKLPMSDMIFASVLKVYTTFSLRRFMSDLETAKEKGYVEKQPCYSSVSHFMQKKELTNILRDLIRKSSLPLSVVERKFAVDGSGFSTSRFARYFSYKHGRDFKYRKWIKCNLICGTKTNVITDVIISNERSHDTLYFPELVKNTAENFNLDVVCADKAYLSRKNYDLVDGLGGTAFIPFKKNVKETTRANKSPVWRKMYHFFMYRNDEFMAYYSARSNVETCFHMIKSKFGDGLRSKNKTAQINEILCKVLCHNIVVVINEMMELGITPNFH